MKPTVTAILLILVVLTPHRARAADSREHAKSESSPLSNLSTETRRQVILSGSRCAVTECENPSRCDLGVGPHLCVEQTCDEVSWRVCAQDRGLRGLWVSQVDVRREQGAPWTRVLYEAGLADLVTPYHNGEHLPDMKYCPTPDHPDRCLQALDQQAAGPSGVPLTLHGETDPRVIVELRDRGIAWLCTWDDPNGGRDRSLVRRGEEMVLWGVYDTGNYDFLIEYAFRDDGSLGFRLGATGYNNSNYSAEPHMHTALWRLDVDLDGSQHDTAKLLTHREGFPAPLQATDVELPFSGGTEGSQLWVDPLFTTLLIEDASVNAHGNHRAYELVPSRQGTPRHRKAGELYTQSDYWVTVWKRGEAGRSAPYAWQLDGNLTPDTFLREPATRGAKDGGPESITDRDLVVWYKGGAHHDPHDEDRSALDVGSTPEGVTTVHWFGFELVPHDFFDDSPLAAPHRSQCEP